MEERLGVTGAICATRGAEVQQWAAREVVDVQESNDAWGWFKKKSLARMVAESGAGGYSLGFD